MPGKRYTDNSMRLKSYDYRNMGAYFVTISCKNKSRYFGSCKNGKVCLSDIGNIAFDHIQKIPDHFQNVLIRQFVVMPDHLHMLIQLKNNVGTLHATSPQNGLCNQSNMSGISPKAGSLPVIIRSYKSSVSRLARKINPDFEWQSRYHERIIRNRFEFTRVQKYIMDNPQNWGT